MIVVAIVGLLASIAIPAFQEYVLRSKFAEGPILLKALTQAEVSFFQNPRVDANGDSLPKCFMGALTEPPFGGAGNKLPWAGNSAFNYLGFYPSGDVYFQYRAMGWNGAPSRASTCGDPAQAVPNAHKAFWTLSQLTLSASRAKIYAVPLRGTDAEELWKGPVLEFESLVEWFAAGSAF